MVVAPLNQIYATEYLIGMHWPDEEKSRNVLITRHSNHGDWIKNHKWVACIVLGPMNPWYLNSDGMWRYKCYTVFNTYQDAYEALWKSLSAKKSYEIQSQGGEADG